MSNGTNGNGPRPPLLSPGRRMTVYAMGGGVWFTGAVWLVLR